MSVLRPTLVFLGGKGGGLQLLLDTSHSLQRAKQRHSLILSKRHAQNNLVEENELVEVEYFGIPHTLLSLLTPHLIPRNLKEILKLIFKANSLRQTLVIQIMPSPFDFVFDFFTPKSTNKILRCIHDAKPHLGEKWPTEKSIKARVRKADFIVCFSEYTSKGIQFEETKKFIKALPHTFYASGQPNPELEVMIQNLKSDNKPLVLSLGRNFHYKGLNSLVDFEPTREGAKLLIAGTGKLKLSGSKRWVLIDKWLTDSEFIFLIRSADILVFPYIEASQSGTIPIAISEGKVIVASDVGGLAEQVMGYPLVHIYKTSDPLGFQQALKSAIRQVKNMDLDTDLFQEYMYSRYGSLSSVILELGDKNG